MGGLLTFSAPNADAAWVLAAKEFSGKTAPLQPGRVQPAFELLHAAFTITDSRQRWVASREPAINPAFALAEVIWILNGMSEASFVNFWNRKLPAYAGNASDYHGAYGFRLRTKFGIDQIKRAADALRGNRDTRQVVLQIWDSFSDMPTPSGDPVDSDVPCNLLSILKVREGKLEWLQVARSNDLFLGVPHNFVQFMTLQEVLAGWIGVEAGTYTHISDSLHVYESDIEKVTNLEARKAPANTDSVAYPFDESARVIEDLGRRMRALQVAEDGNEILDLIASFHGPEGYRNWLRLLGAEAARRYGYPAIASELLYLNSNQLFIALCERWWERLANSRIEQVSRG